MTHGCNAALSSVESLPLLLYILMFGFRASSNQKCNWTRSPSYFVSAQTVRAVLK